MEPELQMKGSGEVLLKMPQDLEDYGCVVGMGQNCSSFLHSIWVVGEVGETGVVGVAGVVGIAEGKER